MHIHSLFHRIRVWGSLVRFSHSVFAIPFAAIMLLIVMRRYPVTLVQVALLVVCVVSARFAAMAFNRVVDARIDAHNERTKNRDIPAGRVSEREAYLLVLVASAVFIAASWMLGVHCAVLAIPVLGVLCGYSFVKRFSSLCHMVLGIGLACAPGGVWYALTATWSWQPIPLMLCVMLWVAGFDILYACQDAEFDRANGLYSVPSVVGVPTARAIAILSHALSVCCLAIVGYTFECGVWFWGGALLFSALIASQHIVVHQRGLDEVDQIFFVRNGLASILLLIFVCFDQVG